MRRVILPTAIAGLAALLASASFAKEETVPPDKVPAPVMKTVKERFKDLTVKGASREMEHGKQVYEVTLDDAGKNIDVTLTPDGTLVKIEKQIAKTSVPASVTKAVEEKYPKAQWKIIEEITEVEKGKETVAGYEVLLLSDKGEIAEIELRADGKILEIEKKKSLEEDEDEDDEKDD